MIFTIQFSQLGKDDIPTAGGKGANLPAYLKMLPQLLRQAIPRWQNEKLPAYLAVIERWKLLDAATATDKQLWSGIQALTVAYATYWFEVSIMLGLAKVTDGLLQRFFRKPKG